MDSTKAFKFTVNGDMSHTVYTYNPNDSTVIGGGRDPIKYFHEKVDHFLRTGSWIVISDEVFPRPGIEANFENGRVWVAGESRQQGHWLIETANGTMMKVRSSSLSLITPKNDKVFTMMSDLGVSYQVASKMVNKGYGKL